MYYLKMSLNMNRILKFLIPLNIKNIKNNLLKKLKCWYNMFNIINVL